MQITDVEAFGVEYELNDPWRLSRDRKLTYRRTTLVRIETDAGITGIGEGFGPDPATIERIVTENFAPDLVGTDPLEIEHIWDTVLPDPGNDTVRNAKIIAASGLDIALWDICGKFHDEPVYRLLDEDIDRPGRLQAYASDLFWAPPGEMADRAVEYVDRGFSGVKTHLGRGREADEDRVAAIRDAIGDAALMVDMNRGYDYPTARRVGRMLESYDVYWYEEPLSSDEVERMSALRETLEVPIAAGENAYTNGAFRRLFESDAVDYAMPDVMRCGGITEATKICTLGDSVDVVCSPHCYSTGIGLAATMHVMAASPSTEWLEFDPTEFPLYESLFTSSLEVTDGFVTPPTDPGLGIDHNAEAIETHRTE